MKFKMKRIVAVAAAIMMLLSVTASAEWVFAGYDTTDLDNIGKVSNEVIDGKYTNKIKVDPVADEDIEWIAESYELAYPHAGYDRLYVEGNWQKITRYNNLFPQWETRLMDYMWELCGDHRIYQRQQTNIPGLGWTWDESDNLAVDATLKTKTTRFAETVDSFKTIGFANIGLDGKIVSDEIADMYKFFGIYHEFGDIVANTPFYLPAGIYRDAAADGPEFYEAQVLRLFDTFTLSLRDEDGHYVVTDEYLANSVASLQSKYVTGPDFVNGGVMTRDVAAEFLAAEDREAWHWDLDTIRYGGGVVTWTEPAYELAEPYAYYQHLIVNGVVCDGSNDAPVIFRYTGGFATPEVEWKYLTWDEVKDFEIETDGGFYDIVEHKYVDGKPTFYEDGTPIYRVPTGEFANCYAKVTETDIEIWRQTGRGADEFIGAVDRVNHDLGGFIDAYVPGTVLYDLSALTPHLGDYPFTVGHCIK